MKKKTAAGIAVCVIIAAAALMLWRSVLSDRTGPADPSEAVYTVTLAELNGMGSAVGAVNRFGGVVEAQEVWSVNQNPDSTIKEILVSVGDEVKAGDPLFTYDTEKYKSDQEQAEIDLERMNNDLEAIGKTIEQLENDQKKAKASEQADYTIRIQDAELQRKQKELDIRSKTIELNKLIENQKNATVTSEIDGVVRTIKNGLSSDFMDTDENDAFMTIMKTGDLRIKGTINEQNIGQIMVGSPVIVHSRTDRAKTWTGTISEINTDSTVSNQSSYYYYSGGSDSESSSYRFYVALDSTEGMMIGQHVYLEPDHGQGNSAAREGVRIPSYYIDGSDPEHPFVWADDGTGRLVRKEITTGEEDEELMMVEVTDGLSMEDAVAFPDETLREGMAAMTGGAS